MYISIAHIKIPRVLLGTSPFIGAGQFERAYEYFQKFYLNPKEIEKLIKFSYSLGVKGIQALPFEPIPQVLAKVLKEIPDLCVIPSVLKAYDIDLFQKFDAPLMFLHAGISNKKNKEELEELLDEIRDTGAIAGIATHKPYEVLTWIKENRIKVNAVLVPFNKAGLFMDTSPDELIKLLRELNVIVFAKKTLGAGRLPVKESLEFVAKTEVIDGITIGVASEEEAKETFSLALSLFSKEVKKK